ncbi:MAG: sulfurtransferase TusA family protein [Desulfobacula sp.]|jgi:TusA-related sulfurtransferase|uniref:sulfurtransferase TusA family protein n=1 Tax=Desulfobacula sp. TaxID=2593537 RepID=UPI001D70D015|nr:sulfurtransferase TusA family protein [Desulfobacula sp.]MBT3485743.1 sulfurtransferase TusA family protein [Desulfobacula sp.]MBT3803367.1 sulfurtransferase TusA family protein [Desulfobacula sp.]MBT4024288.1 sulfurtransferase TusA family protein [Desulfobacula sp.]MBT4198295.1 sulfurtransferase TusA family protein [Desulfobacula sp.]
MSNEIKADKTLDLKGLACPMPVVKISKGIQEVEIGQVVKAVTTDPGSLTDFPAWARTTGHEIVQTVQGDDEISFYVKRVV